MVFDLTNLSEFKLQIQLYIKLYKKNCNKRMLFSTFTAGATIKWPGNKKRIALIKITVTVFFAWIDFLFFFFSFLQIAYE